MPTFDRPVLQEVFAARPGARGLRDARHQLLVLTGSKTFYALVPRRQDRTVGTYADARGDGNVLTRRGARRPAAKGRR